MAALSSCTPISPLRTLFHPDIYYRVANAIYAFNLEKEMDLRLIKKMAFNALKIFCNVNGIAFAVDLENNLDKLTDEIMDKLTELKEQV